MNVRYLTRRKGEVLRLAMSSTMPGCWRVLAATDGGSRYFGDPFMSRANAEALRDRLVARAEQRHGFREDVRVVRQSERMTAWTW